MISFFRKIRQIKNPMVLEQQYKTLLSSMAFKNGCTLSIAMSQSYFLPSLNKIEKLTKQAIQFINSETIK